MLIEKLGQKSKHQHLRELVLLEDKDEGLRNALPFFLNSLKS